MPPSPANTSQPFLGSGLLRPFVRDQKNDFANSVGVDLIKACVAQILGTFASDPNGTMQGEIPWRPSFGSRIYLLKHRKGPMLNELARHYALEAIQQWEPRVTISSCVASFDEDTRTLLVQLRYNVISQNVAGNNVLFQDVDQDVTIPLAA